MLASVATWPIESMNTEPGRGIPSAQIAVAAPSAISVHWTSQTSVCVVFSSRYCDRWRRCRGFTLATLMRYLPRLRSDYSDRPTDCESAANRVGFETLH